MKRKTNLFYGAGKDSNFVTFSNYTEALTGNILATDAKMFPSKFICLYIPKLDCEEFETEKQNFITKWLSGYYENKLAVLRDNCINNDVNVENTICPLKYLLDVVKNYDPDMKITFISEICEQEYNGTFMDNICIIESSAKAKEYDYTTYFDTSKQIPVEDFGHLYGWSEAIKMPNEYRDVTPKFDNTGLQDNNDIIESRLYYPNIDTNNLDSMLVESSEQLDAIKFNVLIPLFDIMIYDFNADGSIDNEAKPSESEVGGPLIFNSANYKNQYDTPIGMWFSDKVVSLDRGTDISGSYRPSWSLCISSQFKPFPYSDKYPNEINEYDNPDKFATFALVLAKQAALLNEMTELKEKVSNMKYSNVVSANTDGVKYTTLSDLDTLKDEVEKIKEQIDSIDDIYNDSINKNAAAYTQFWRTNELFNSYYSDFLGYHGEIMSYYNQYADVASTINEHVNPMLEVFDEKYNRANSQYDEIVTKYTEFTTDYATFRENYDSYYLPSTGYFNESYGYYAPSYTYFNDAYTYYVPSYAYYVPAYQYFVPSYQRFVQVIVDELWAEKAFAYFEDTYNSYYTPSYGKFVEDYGVFRNDYDSYYVPSYSYFNDAYGYYVPSYTYFNEAYTYYVPSYAYYVPAYQYFVPSYQRFVQVIVDELWAETTYHEFVTPAYAYFVPEIGYFRPEMGYFRPNMGHFRNSYGFFSNAYHQYFVPSYQYFRGSYPYFEAYYPKFDEQMRENIELWSYYTTSYEDFRVKFGYFNDRYLAREDFENKYAYYRTSYDDYYVPSYWSYFVPEVGYFRPNVGYFRNSYGYFASAYNNYLNGYSYFRTAYNGFLYSYNEFNTSYDHFYEMYKPFAEYEAQYTDFNSKYGDFRDRYDVFTGKYNEFTSNYSRLIDRIEELETENTAQSTKITNLETNVSTLDNKITTLTAVIQNLNTKIAELEAQINNE